MALLRSIFPCVCLTDDENDIQSTRSDDRTAAEIVNKIYAAEKSGNALKTELHNIVLTNGWSEYLAEAILNALDAAIRAG
jgi:hypothetical protein